MPFDSAGLYTPPTGATNAAPGDVIRSATWNSIFTDMATALSDLGQQSWVASPRSITTPASFTVAAIDAVILIEASAPTITLPLSATKEGPVRIHGAAAGIFSANNSLIVPSGGETISGQASIALTVDYQVVTLYPLASGGYLVG